MKKQSFILLLAVLCIIAANNVMATIRVVSNQTLNNPETYTVIDSAIAHSSQGDTVYVQGSTISHNQVHLYKRLVLIGAGYYTTGLSHNYNSSISTIYLDSNATNSVITGFNINTLTSIYTYPNNLKLFRNKISTIYIYGNNWNVYNNYISTSTYFENNVHNLVFSNNVIVGNGVLYNDGGSGTMSNCIFDHNYIYQTGFNVTFSIIENSIITNNIIINSQNPFFNIHSCIFSNNLYYSGGNGVSTAWDPNTNFGSNNIVSQQLAGNPNLDNPPTNANTPDTWDFQISLGFFSPISFNNATDGSNIGPSGGNYAITKMPTVPSIPQVTIVSAINPVLYQGQSLNVNIKGRVRK